MAKYEYPCPNMKRAKRWVTCTLPLQNLAVGETADCTVSVLDQRDWGGCVDVQMVSAGSPAASATCADRAEHRRTRWTNTVIDTPADTFTCCALEAE